NAVVELLGIYQGFVVAFAPDSRGSIFLPGSIIDVSIDPTTKPQAHLVRRLRRADRTGNDFLQLVLHDISGLLLILDSRIRHEWTSGYRRCTVLPNGRYLN